jgi:hypothetical protein
MGEHLPLRSPLRVTTLSSLEEHKCFKGVFTPRGELHRGKSSLLGLNKNWPVYIHTD